MSSAIFNGEIVTLAEMATSREQRYLRQQFLLQKFPHASLLCATMNIPGPIKSSPILNQVFQDMITLIKEPLQGSLLIERNEHLKTGWEYYAVTSLNHLDLKKKMIVIENSHSLGRLMDLDVLSCNEQNLPKTISRQDLGFPSRKCYICQENAKYCSRSRKHSAEDMQKAIAKRIKTFYSGGEICQKSV